MTWSKLCSPSIRVRLYPALKLLSRGLLSISPIQNRRIGQSRVSFVSIPFYRRWYNSIPQLQRSFYFSACLFFGVVYYILSDTDSKTETTAAVRRIYSPKKCDIKELTQETAEKWKELLETGKDSDFQLIVNGEVFHLHKEILALRSTFFQDLFEKNTLMKTLFPIKQLEKNDFSVEAMKKMVNYIYTMEPIEMDEDAPEVGRIAKHFGLLKEMKRHLTEMDITQENVFSLAYMRGLLFQEKFISGKYFWDSLRFIEDNKKELEEKFAELKENKPRNAIALLNGIFLYHRLNVED